MLYFICLCRNVKRKRPQSHGFCGCGRFQYIRYDLFLLLLGHATNIAAILGVDRDEVTLVDEERHANLGAGLQCGGLCGVGSGVTLHARLRVSHHEVVLGGISAERMAPSSAESCTSTTSPSFMNSPPVMRSRLIGNCS